jgi:hypothetical protein
VFAAGVLGPLGIQLLGLAVTLILAVAVGMLMARLLRARPASQGH